jgi:hypothetical protein
LATYGWGLFRYLDVLEDRPRHRTPPEVLSDFAFNAYLGYRYTTDPLSRVMIDLSNIRSRGVGGPSDAPTSTTAPVASKRTSESRKAFKAKSAHGFRKTKGVSARGKCPKGHYWSYKKKKCMKSKFRR